MTNFADRVLPASFVLFCPLCLQAATLRVPSEFPTLQSALDAARDGDLLGHLFLGGPAPPAPFPGCGEDPTTDPLSCETPTVCR